jgi:Divergent InlB B-repeat domain
LTAQAASGHSFAGWVGACSGTASCTVTMDIAKSVLANFSATVVAPPTTVEPLVLYTDIASGPNTGGENNKGIYLSIFGKNFGAHSASVKVYINGVEVDNYRYFGPSKGRTDIQQVTVQVGALGNPVVGTPLPIKVVVGGVASNIDQTFTVNPGSIYFVDNVNGVDTSTITSGGDFANPFKTVQKNAGKKLDFAIDPASSAGAWGRVRAGDFIVMRGRGVAYSDIGFDTYFLRALNKSGSAPGTSPACAGCTGSGPISILGYPGEDVFVNNAYGAATASNGAFSSASNARIQEGKGSWITIAGLRVESGNDDGVINTQLGGNGWRVVNNQLSAATAVANVNALAGGIVGSGANQFWVGNYIHDVYQGPNNGNSPLQNHGIYVGDDPVSAGSASYEIAYNHIAKIWGGNGFQIHVGAGVTGVANNIRFHHNVIHDVGKHGINIADGAQNNIAVWNNLVYNTTYAGIRFGGTSYVRDLKLYNNTFYNTATSGTTDPSSAANFAALTNEMVPNAANQIDVRNNIFFPASGTRYIIDMNGAFGNTSNIGPVTHNLWFGGTGTNPATTFSINSLQGNPAFVLSGSNFHLDAGSPAIDKGTAIVSSLVKDDHDAATSTLARTLRPQSGAFDIGAYER